MDTLDTVLAEVEELFYIPISRINSIASRFRDAMADGLAGKQSSLKMLPSFIGSPTGQEQGRVVAVDFGGTNVRVMLIELTTYGQARVIERRSFPLKDKLNKYDYTAATSSGVELFKFIAGKIAEIVPQEGIFPLGHTFSFPCRQYSVNKAVLISWTKEIKTEGVEGRDVGELLQAGLDSNGLSHVKSHAVINDTTGTLLAAAYSDAAADIGAILGTGHNSCYLEPYHPANRQAMIINLESGNFDEVVQTKYDVLLDAASEKPGAQRLEKMVSGQYLGEIVRLIVKELVAQGHIQAGLERLAVPYSLPTNDISTLLADSSKELNGVAAIVTSNWGIAEITLSERKAIQKVAGYVAARSARLAAATWAGVLLKIDPNLERQHTIAVDGSLFEKMPGYSRYLTQAIADIYGDKTSRVSVKLSKDGSGIGAAIAAAMAYRNSL
ncbi:hexokinase [Sporomusa aerivorans]|uniref:hexokinase n=1 Tax=Sporomusa aerivorans TaxID=204936 RepID=UPI003529E6E6